MARGFKKVVRLRLTLERQENTLTREIAEEKPGGSKLGKSCSSWADKRGASLELADSGGQRSASREELDFQGFSGTCALNHPPRENRD